MSAGGRRQKIGALQDLCDAWNAKYPVGTKVNYLFMTYESASAAQLVIDSPSIQLKDHLGWVSLEALKVIRPYSLSRGPQ
jgi:hypothetical protein